MEIGDLAGIYTEITGSKPNMKCQNCAFDTLVRIIKLIRIYEKENSITEGN
jgi:predicted transcriptional regulator